MSDDFATYIEGQRKMLKERHSSLIKHKELLLAAADKEIREVEKELVAIDAYERAKTGKAAPASTTRVRRGSRREEIVNALRDSPAGMSRGDLLERFGLKGDKSGEMSVSNALTALTKSGQVIREAGKYHVPASQLAAAAE